MVLLFTGTSTGNMYQEGQRYSGSNGDTFVANRDGSFTNERSGRTSVGSSQSADVSWFSKGESREAHPVLYTDAGRAVYERPGGGGSGPASAQVTNEVTSASGGSAGGSGPGSAVVSTGGPKAGGSGAGSSFVTIGGPLGPKLKETHTQLLLGGTGWTHNPRWSDTAEWEERYGEPGDWLGGIVTMGVDAGHNARRVFDEYASSVLAQPPVKGGGGWDKLVDWDARISQQLHRSFGTGMVVPMGGF